MAPLRSGPCQWCTRHRAHGAAPPLAAGECQPSGGPNWTCTGDDTDGETHTISSSSFSFDLGDPLDQFTPASQYHGDTTDSVAAFSVTAVNQDGVVNLYQNSHIHNSSTSADSAGLLLSAGTSSDITLNIFDASEDGSAAGEITGGYHGILATTDGNQINSIAIINNGHVSGGDGAALQSIGAGTLLLAVENHSYASMIGATGFAANGDLQDIYDNSFGLTAGLAFDGMNISTVQGVPSQPSENAVGILNQSGVVAGNQDGVRIDSIGGTFGVDGTDVVIDNAGTADNEKHSGLIVGVNEDGVGIGGVQGNVAIHNDFTQRDSIDFSQLDPRVGDPETGLIAGLPDTFTTGIWGNWAGIAIRDVAHRVSISNVSGRVVGVNNEGILLQNINPEGNAGSEAVNIDNHAASGLPGSLIWGGTDGVELDDIFGLVKINNDLGVIYGAFGDGIHIHNAQGNQNIRNFGGLVYGRDSGVTLTTTAEGQLTVNNGGGDGGQIGIVYGRFSGLDLSNQDGVAIDNFSGGAILGGGSSPVILTDVNNGVGAANIYNAGLISGVGLETEPGAGSGFVLPTFAVSGNAFDPPNVPSVTIDYARIFSDAADIAAFGSSGGAEGSIGSLGEYGAAAALNLIQSVRGSVSVLNDTGGLMIGRVNLFGSSGAEADEAPVVGNTIVNFGKWFTTDAAESETGRPLFAPSNLLSGAGQDSIYNLGLIQTAFQGSTDPEGPAAEKTTFVLDDFYNGSAPAGTKAIPSYAGFVSMIDGATGDETAILGKYHGASQAGFYAYVGVDVDFAGGTSDVLQIGLKESTDENKTTTEEPSAEIDGSTGIIIHKTSTSTGGINQDGIVVVSSTANDVNPASKQCFDKPCKSGDTFYISSLSPDYVEANGIGAIQDGIFTWYLTEQATVAPPDPNFLAKSTFAPWTGGDAAGLITGAQNIWYDATGVVEDHVYGNHFPAIGGGGGGADLAVEPGAPGEAAGRSATGLWARMSGNWTNQDARVSDPIFGSVDTSFDQSTFNVLGGADFSPTGLAGGFRFGILGGYTTSNLDFAIGTESADYKGGVLGGYAAYTNGGFYADAQVNWNPLDMTFHVASSAIDTNGDSIGVLANTGYRMDRGRFFVEPIASFTYVNTGVDDFASGGGTVSFRNGESLRAGAGGRFGTNFATSGGTITELSLLGKAWNEFEDANRVTVSDGAGHTATYSDSISGLFGEVTATATIYSADRSVSGFIAGGAKFGDDFKSWSAKAGARKTF